MLRKALATLPPTLDKTYERILSTISEDDSEYAFRILQWLACSIRPLLVEEVAEVVAIDVARVPAFDRDEVLEDPLEVLNICSSLVTITTYSDYRDVEPTQRFVALAHYSVQEYLLSDRIRQSKARQYSMQDIACQDAIARGCLLYLLQLQDLGTCSKEVLRRFRLAQYSAKYWIRHAQKTGEQLQTTSRNAMSLFSLNNPAYFTWIQLCDPDQPGRNPDFSRTVQELPSPLYYAAGTGLNIVVKLLLDKGADVNAQGGHHGSALQAASICGYKEIVQSLLNNDANVNAQGGHQGNALQAASVGGYNELVQLLINNGAHVNAQGGFYSNALQAASVHGHEETVQLLLNNNANVNEQGKRRNATLRAASYHGYKEIVKLLLEAGAYVAANGMDPIFGTIINLLAFYGFTDLLHLCYQQFHADLSLVGFHGQTPLQLAARGGHIDAFQYLIHQGQNPTTLDRKGDGLLSYAASGGSLEVLDAALHKGARSSSKSGHWTPLHWACRAGNAQVVELLIKEGLRSECVTVTQPEGEWSPLAIAVFHKNAKMLEGLSTSCKHLLSTESNIVQLHGERHHHHTCDGCLHRIYGPRFHCLTCPDLDYCFMCKPFLESLHIDHEWECLLASEDVKIIQ